MIKRLISRKVDVFECILPDEHVSPPIFACKFAQKQGEIKKLPFLHPSSLYTQITIKDYLGMYYIENYVLTANSWVILNQQLTNLH